MGDVNHDSSVMEDVVRENGELHLRRRRTNPALAHDLGGEVFGVLWRTVAGIRREEGGDSIPDEFAGSEGMGFPANPLSSGGGGAIALLDSRGKDV